METLEQPGAPALPDRRLIGLLLSLLKPARRTVIALLVAYLLSAIRMFESGAASASEIVDGLKIGCALPMGPLALSDLVGLDTLMSVAEVMFD